MDASGDLQQPRRLVEGYLAQLRAFGCFCDEALGERIESVVVERVGFVKAYCEFLEHVGNLRFGDGEVPLLYNTQQWPEGVEPAGFVSPDSLIAPSQYFTALAVSWGFQATMDKEEASPLPRFLKAALWVARRHGVPTAIHYVFALREHGLILSTRTLYGTVDALIRGYRIAASDSSLYETFFGGSMPEHPRALIQAELAEVDLEAPFTRSAGPLLQTLLSLASAQVERVRSAVSYDEWLRSQFVLSSFLDVIVHLVPKHVPSVSPTVRSALDHFEEMRADAGGIAALVRRGVISRPLCAVFDLNIPTLIAMIGADRLVHERAVVPRALQGVLIDGQRHHDLPVEWARLSPAYAQALCDATLDSPRMLDSLKQFTTQQILNNAAAAEVFDEFDAPASIRLLLAEEFSGELDRRNLQRLREEIGRIKELRSNTSEPPTDNHNGTGEDWGGEWLAENRDWVTSVHRRVDTAMKHEDITQRLQRAMAMGDKGNRKGAASLVEELVADYPWFHPLLYELGVALDQADRSSLALVTLEAALLVAPENPLYWESLSIVLRRLGSDVAARLALGTIAMLRSSPRLADAPDLKEYWRQWDARWA
jgi:hypothetical protein